MKPEKLIEASAEHLLNDSPDPVVQFLTLRDVLGRSKDDTELRQAKKGLEKSVHVKLLKDEQWKDGSWGRYHTKDYSAGQEIGTTEVGVMRAVILGLDKNDALLKKSIKYSRKAAVGG